MSMLKTFRIRYRRADNPGYQYWTFKQADTSEAAIAAARAEFAGYYGPEAAEQITDIKAVEMRERRPEADPALEGWPI